MSLIEWIPFCVFAYCAVAAAADRTPTAASIESAVLHFSYELEQLIDSEEQPCKNFYAYVCARSLNDSKILRAQSKQQEQKRFEKFIATANDELILDMELKLKQFYKACKGARGVKALNSTQIYYAVGGWPAIESGSAVAVQQRRRQDMNWLGVLANFHEIGVAYFFETRIDMKSNKRVVHLQPDATMRYTMRKFEQLVHNVMYEYAIDAARAPLVVLEIMNFERSRREIAKMEVTAEKMDFSYANFKSTMLGNKLHLDWDAYFRKLLGKPLKPTDIVTLIQLPKVVKYFELLQNTTLNRLLNWIWTDYLMDKTSSDCELLIESYFGPVYEHIMRRASSDRVQMAQMYAKMGRAYDELLPPSVWIDEMSQQNSKQLLGRIIHLTLNGDATLDIVYKLLQLEPRNFYRSLEQLQRFHAKQLKHEHLSTPNPIDRAAGDYMKILQTISALLQTQNLTIPLNYILAGDTFAEHMVAGGSSTHTMGAWRSMDSDRDFKRFQNCTSRERKSLKYNINDLLLKLLAQRQAHHAYEQWLAQDVKLRQRLDTLLTAGRLQLTLQRLYFVGNALVSCRHKVSSSSMSRERQQQLLHDRLRNTVAFTKAFNCHAGDELYASGRHQDTCKVL